MWHSSTQRGVAARDVIADIADIKDSFDLLKGRIFENSTMWLQKARMLGIHRIKTENMIGSFPIILICGGK